MPDEIADEVARPAHAALEEGEAQIGEAVGHAAENEGTREGVARIGEVTDVVEREAVDRLAAVPAHAARVRGDRHFQVETRAPERIVVVGALEAERVDEHAPVGQGVGH